MSLSSDCSERATEMNRAPQRRTGLGLVRSAAVLAIGGMLAMAPATPARAGLGACVSAIEDTGTTAEKIGAAEAQAAACASDAQHDPVMAAAIAIMVGLGIDGQFTDPNTGLPSSDLCRQLVDSTIAKVIAQALKDAGLGSVFGDDYLQQVIDGTASLTGVLSSYVDCGCQVAGAAGDAAAVIAQDAHDVEGCATFLTDAVGDVVNVLASGADSAGEYIECHIVGNCLTPGVQQEQVECSSPPTWQCSPGISLDLCGAQEIQWLQANAPACGGPPPACPYGDANGVCKWCPDGQALQNGQCAACPAGTQSCTIDSDQNTWSIGFSVWTPSLTGDSCVESGGGQQGVCGGGQVASQNQDTGTCACCPGPTSAPFCSHDLDSQGYTNGILNTAYSPDANNQCGPSLQPTTWGPHVACPAGQNVYEDGNAGVCGCCPAPASVPDCKVAPDAKSYQAWAVASTWSFAGNSCQQALTQPADIQDVLCGAGEQAVNHRNGTCSCVANLRTGIPDEPRKPKPNVARDCGALGAAFIRNPRNAAECSRCARGTAPNADRTACVPLQAKQSDVPAQRKPAKDTVRGGLQCPPGKIPNSRGTACIIDLGEGGTGPSTRSGSNPGSSRGAPRTGPSPGIVDLPRGPTPSRKP